MKWFSFLHRNERRDILSAEFEAAVNKVITADTVADATRQPYITEEGALNLTAVWACVRILSETVGTLPLHLYRRTARGRERQYDHLCHRLVQAPNSYSTRFDLMHHLMVSCSVGQRLCPHFSGQTLSSRSAEVHPSCPYRAAPYRQRRTLLPIGHGRTAPERRRHPLARTLDQWL